ncbi:hypothetical protein IW140_001703 [Coemansia sp. RSA 1813]|nr:hypothetical protein EV178_001499 [Coemansia sp. RSA 1646]KAJ1772521.1 hypothetical protein LPJ74_001422 [Coemansia sp. RSA 1843]KAJ2090924.1 hypothetical protein IW138_002328 [Coemansia sp. RSA 986]KAJ2214008.1 hypothetical protein EV179_003363 [Coemansia sp. RSA 487]KAJ2571249.1 hypothetical protein IW140_001703 [Coemansia sp. RSA 1813]
MAVDTRGSSEEYAKTVEYIRKLCEGDDTNASMVPSNDDAQNMPNGSAGGSSGATLQKGKAAASPGPATPASTRSRGRVNGTGAGPHSSASRSSSCGPRKQTNGVSGSHPNPGIKEQPEHDTCDACDQPGHFVCCDLCPRVFHFFCADPPMSREAVSKIDHWFCRECAHRVSRKRKSRAHVKNIFYPLISAMEFKNPRVFAVPDEIRRQFDGVERDADGGFINVREDRPQRVNAGPANRDFTRLVDDHNEAIMCYRCGLSALHGLMVRCDYCPLNWHWDCLDPPLCSAPPPHKRWMCPNHADHAIRRHRKFRKERIIDMTDAPESARNNGIVDIIDDDPPTFELFDPKVKYKVPSSRIRKEFAKNSAPCVVDLGIKQKVTFEAADHIASSNVDVPQQPNIMPRKLTSSLVKTLDADSAKSQTLPPPVMSMAEWLQSIVAFQQDVARFVMTTAKQAVLQETYDDSKPHVEDLSANASKDDKITILSNIATQVLSPLIRESAASNSDEQNSSGKHSTNVDSLDEENTKRPTDPASTIDNDISKSAKSKSEDITSCVNHSTEDMDILAAASALEELPNSIANVKINYSIADYGKSDHGLEKSHCSGADTNDAECRRTHLLDKHGLSEAEARDAIERLLGTDTDNSSDGNKRKRSDACSCEGTVGEETDSAKRTRPLESRNDNPDAAESVQKQLTNGDTPSLTRATHISELVMMLLRERGADALLDFLAS